MTLVIKSEIDKMMPDIIKRNEHSPEKKSEIVWRFEAAIFYGNRLFYRQFSKEPFLNFISTLYNKMEWRVGHELPLTDHGLISVIKQFHQKTKAVLELKQRYSIS